MNNIYSNADTNLLGVWFVNYSPFVYIWRQVSILTKKVLYKSKSQPENLTIAYQYFVSCTLSLPVAITIAIIPEMLKLIVTPIILPIMLYYS